MSLALDYFGPSVGSSPGHGSGALVLHVYRALCCRLLEATETDQRYRYEAKADQRYRPAECEQASGPKRKTDYEDEQVPSLCRCRSHRCPSLVLCVVH